MILHHHLSRLRLFLVTFCLFALAGLCHAETEDEAWTLYQLAVKAFESGDLNQSRRLIEQARLLKPHDGTIVLNKVMTYRLRQSARGIERVSTMEGDSKDYRPSQLLAQIDTLVAERKERQRLIDKTGQQPLLRLAARLLDKDADGYLQTGETLVLELTVANRGGGGAEALAVQLRSPHPLPALNQRLDIGLLAAGEETQERIEFVLPRGFNESELELDIQTDERDGYNADPLNTVFAVIPWQKPQLRVYPAPDNPVLIAGKSGTLRFTLRNEGPYPVRDIALNTEFSQSGLTLIEQQWPDQYQNIPPRAERQLVLTVMPASDFNPVQNPAVNFVLKDLRHTAAQPLYAKVASFPVVVTGGSQRYQTGNAVAEVRNPATPVIIQDGFAPRLNRNPTTQRNSYALVIGNRDYSQRNMPVPYALNDAKLMRKVFTDVVGIPPDNIIQLNNASLADLRTTLGNDGEEGRLHHLLKREVSGQARTLYVFYSGHGLPAKNRDWSAYLMPSDGNPDYIEHSGYALDRFYAQLSLARAEKIVVFLDACFSGQSPAGNLFPGTSYGTLKTTRMPSKPQDQRLHILTAATSDDMGLWLDQAGQGLFTTYLAQGLSGLADQGDKRLSVRELFSFVQGKVMAASAQMARQQTPSMTGRLDTEIVEYGY